MTITIPTVELVGLLNDAAAFASPDKDSITYRTVHLEWDGTELHAMGTDGLHAGWSRWNPSDPPPEALNDVQEDLFTDWGSDDDAPWTATVDLDDAKEAAKMFKLPPKEGWTPLTLHCGINDLVIARQRLDKHTALKQEMRRDVLGAGSQFPDVRALLEESTGPDRPVQALAFTACRLASFAKVRVRGPLELTFTGPDPDSKVRVRIGNRFDGLIMPVRADADNEQLAA